MACGTEYLLGDDAAYAFVSGVTARSGLPAEYWTKAVGFQPDTLAWFSEHNVSALDTAPRHLRLQATVEGSGVLVSGPEWNNLVQVSDGLWAGWGAAPALRFGQDVAKATTDLKDADATARSASPERYGIFFKGHTAKRFGWLELGPYRHATLRAVVNWSQFETLASELRLQFQPVRATQSTGGDMMMTVGARPGGGTGDTSLLPDGKPLVAEFNHDSDRRVHADDVVRLKTTGDAQFVPLVQALVNGGQFFIANHNAPPNQLPYEAFPDPVGGINCPVPYVLLNCTADIWDGYNSNSFVSGLLGSASLPLPNVSARRYTGWTRPVLPTKFGVGQ